MAVRYVDDGGDNSDGLTWAKAYTSINALIAAEASFLTTGGNIVYFGHDSVCQATNTGHLTIAGPTGQQAVYFISVTQGTTTYQKATANQIDTSEGAYNLTFDGAFYLHGMRLNSGGDINFYTVGTLHVEYIYVDECTLKPGADEQLRLQSAKLFNCTVDLTNDGTTQRVTNLLNDAYQYSQIDGLTFANAAYRSGEIFYYTRGGVYVYSGIDMSGFIHASWGGVVDGGVNRGPITLCNCKTPATWSPVGAGTAAPYSDVRMYNVGPSDAPTYHYHKTHQATLTSSTAVTRTGGAEIESTGTSWLLETTSYCEEANPYKTDWIYGVIDSTGSKNFDVFLTNDSADFTDDEVHLEVQYLGTSGEPLWTLVDNSTLSDDTTSTWSGAGPSYTYKQRLRLTATVNETGQYRARVVVRKASIASSAYFYIDPKVTVS